MLSSIGCSQGLSVGPWDWRWWYWNHCAGISTFCPTWRAGKKCKKRKHHQGSHCENSDSNKKSNVGNTNHSRPLPAPSHKEAQQCVSQFNIPRPTNLSVPLIFLSVQHYWTLAHPRRGTARQQPLPKVKFKEHKFCWNGDIKVLRDLSFNLNHLLKSTDT